MKTPRARTRGSTSPRSRSAASASGRSASCPSRPTPPSARRSATRSPTCVDRARLQGRRRVQRDQRSTRSSAATGAASSSSTTTADFLAGRWREYRQFGGLGGLTSDGGRPRRLRPEGDRLLPAGPVVRPRRTSPSRPASASSRWTTRTTRSSTPTTATPDGTLQPDRRDPGLSEQPDLAPLRPLLGPGREDGRPLLASAATGAAPRPCFWAQLFTSNGLRGTQYIIFARATPPAT